MSENPPPPQMRRLRVLFLLAFGSSMSILSMDFFAPSMPDATRGLATTPDAIKSSFVLFMLGFGCGPFLWGYLADHVGRRRTLLAGVSCYVLASLGCALSPGIASFLACRFAQGVAAASGSVISRAVLRDVYGPGGATKAIARMFLIMVWVPITAPFVGGMISSWFHWRISFAVMAAVAGMVLTGSFLWLKETNPAHEPSAMPHRRRWVEILARREFLGAALPNMFCFAAVLLFQTAYSYIGEARFGFTSRDSGFILTGFNIAISAGCYLVMVTVPRIGIEDSISAGMRMMVIGFCGFGVVALVAEPSLVLVSCCLACAGVGMGMVVSLNTGQALIPFPHAAGTAAAIFLLVQSFGAAAINFAASTLPEAGLHELALMLAACSILALATSRLARAPLSARDGS